MNSIPPDPSPLPPRIGAVRNAASSQPPLGQSPEEREPISSIVGVVDAMLRQPRRVMYQLRQPGSGQVAVWMLMVAVVCCILYGLVVGSFSMGAQLWGAPLKVAGGLVISALICLPSLYIFTCLSGSQARLAEMAGLLAGLLVLVAILLVGFAPVAWLFSQSTESVAWMGTLHLLFWGIASFFGLRFLAAGFACSHAKSRAGLNTWIVIFLLVTLQMTTALRPIVGTADRFLPEDKMFFISHWQECLLPSSRAPATPGWHVNPPRN